MTISDNQLYFTLAICAFAASFVVWQLINLYLELRHDAFINQFNKWLEYHGIATVNRFLVNPHGNVINKKMVELKNLGEYYVVTMDITIKVRREKVVCKALYCFTASQSNALFWQGSKYFYPENFVKIIKQDLMDIGVLKVISIDNVERVLRTKETVNKTINAFLDENDVKTTGITNDALTA